MATPPVVKSFLLADTVLQDRATGKWSVVGIFDQIHATSFPCLHSSISLYIKLADVLGRYKVRIDFRDGSDARVSTFEGIDLEVKDRGQHVEFAVNARGLRLEGPGQFLFQLYMNDEYVASAPLQVIRVEPPRAT